MSVTWVTLTRSFASDSSAIPPLAIFLVRRMMECNMDLQKCLSAGIPSHIWPVEAD